MRYYGKRSFIDGTVNDPEDWLAGITSQNTCFFLLYHDLDPVMALWFTDHAQTHAWGHFFWVPSKIKHKEKVFALRWALKKVFRVLAYPIIMGKTPTDNKRAVDYLREVGFTVVGDIPSMLYSSVKDQPVDATLIYIKREDLDKDENL
jgi:RimJ/RimL family protein N-acetyltransferase